MAARLAWVLLIPWQVRGKTGGALEDCFQRFYGLAGTKPVSRAGSEPATPGSKVRFGPCSAVTCDIAAYHNMRSSIGSPYYVLHQMLGDSTSSATVRTLLAHRTRPHEHVTPQGFDRLLPHLGVRSLHKRGELALQSDRVAPLPAVTLRCHCSPTNVAYPTSPSLKQGPRRGAERSPCAPLKGMASCSTCPPA